MFKIISLAILLAIMGTMMACAPETDSNNSATTTQTVEEDRPGGGATPTEAYKNLFTAVKAKDTEAIKSNLTKGTIAFADMVSKQNKKPLEEVFSNGFTATTFSEQMPQIRDERIDGNMGAVEVWNAKENLWEDLGFIKEGGAWRLAIGEKFGGTFKSPGKGRDRLEREAANLSSNNMIEIKPAANANANSNVTVIVPKNVPATPRNP
ncbi:hypothetical protein BH24ACI3_BH24ACI3_06740 [soil metagenome]